MEIFPFLNYRERNTSLMQVCNDATNPFQLAWLMMHEENINDYHAVAVLFLFTEVIYHSTNSLGDGIETDMK